MWISDRRLYLDADGNVVEANDSKRARLLVAAGGRIPMAQAKALGLVIDVKAEEPVEMVVEVVEVVVTDEPEEKAEEPKEDKAQKPASDKAVKPSRNKSK